MIWRGIPNGREQTQPGNGKTDQRWEEKKETQCKKNQSPSGESQQTIPVEAAGTQGEMLKAAGVRPSAQDPAWSRT